MLVSSQFKFGLEGFCQSLSQALLDSVLDLGYIVLTAALFARPQDNDHFAGCDAWSLPCPTVKQPSDWTINSGLYNNSRVQKHDRIGNDMRGGQFNPCVLWQRDLDYCCYTRPPHTHIQHIQYTCKHTLHAPSSICVLPLVKTHPVWCHSFSCMWLVKTTDVSTGTFQSSPSSLLSPLLLTLHCPSNYPSVFYTCVFSTLSLSVLPSPLSLSLSHFWAHTRLDSPVWPQMCTISAQTDGALCGGRRKCLCNSCIKPCPRSCEVLMCVCVH